MSEDIPTKSGKIILEKEVVIAVEGRNFERFLDSKIKNRADFENIQLVDFKKFDEKDFDLNGWLRLIKVIPGFGQLKGLGIILDAEEDASRMQQSVESSLQNNDFVVPKNPKDIASGVPNVSYLIIPDGEQSGCLEHAILGAVTPKLPVQCVEDFLDCVEVDYEQKNIQVRKDEYAIENWRAKVKVNALIACSKKPESSIGVSSWQKMWDWDRPSLKVMLDFIRQLASSY